MTKDVVVFAKKIQNIQGLRGIAVLFVVFTHMFHVETKYALFDYVVPELILIGASGVDLFFLISGFVMISVTRSVFQSRKGIQKFLYHRISRIYPLYWFYSSIILCVYFVQPSFVNSSQGNQVNILESFLLLPQNLLPLVNVGWTLIHEMYFYSVFAVLLFLPKNYLLPGLIGWGGLILVGNIILSGSNNSFFEIYFSPLTLEFIIGCLMGILYFSRSIKGNANAIALIALAVWIVGYYLFREITGNETPSEWMRVLVFGFPAALALYAALLYEKNHGAIMPSWICKVGDVSYSVYLSHVLVLGVVGRFWSLFAVEGYWDNIVMLLIMLIAVLIYGQVSYRYIERVMLDKTRGLEKYIFPSKDDSSENVVGKKFEESS